MKIDDVRHNGRAVVARAQPVKLRRHLRIGSDANRAGCKRHAAEQARGGLACGGLVLCGRVRRGAAAAAPGTTRAAAHSATAVTAHFPNQMASDV